jgi:hypothetical protein
MSEYDTDILSWSERQGLAGDAIDFRRLLEHASLRLTDSLLCGGNVRIRLV